MEDNILIEVRKLKDDLASEFRYDLREMLNDAIKKQKESGFRIVNFSKKEKITGVSQTV